jgi:hypothetical protein
LHQFTGFYCPGVSPIEKAPTVVEAFSLIGDIVLLGVYRHLLDELDRFALSTESASVILAGDTHSPLKVAAGLGVVTEPHSVDVLVLHGFLLGW